MPPPSVQEAPSATTRATAGTPTTTATLLCGAGQLNCSDYTGDSYTITTKGGAWTFAGDPPSLGDMIKDTARFIQGLGAGVLGCVRYLIKCADDLKRVAALPLLATATLGLGLTEGLACATGLGCAVASPVLLPAIGLTGYATVAYAKRLWEDRRELFNFQDCTVDAFFCGEHS